MLKLNQKVCQLKKKLFFRCKRLESVSISSEESASFEDGAFKECVSLANFTINSNIIEIGDGSFKGCSSLNSVEFSVDEIALSRRAFISSGLKSLSISSKGDIILGEEAFRGCNKMNSVTISSPKNIVIDEYAFAECDSLEYVSISSENEIETSLSNKAFFQSGLKSLSISSKGDIILGEEAFRECHKMNNVTISSPKNIVVSEYTFADCDSLEYVSISSEKLTLKNEAFTECHHLFLFNYHGNEEPECSGYPFGSSEVQYVRVPERYSSHSFCGINVLQDTPSCADILSLNNYCFKVVYCSTSDVEILMRENASAWENQKDECFEHLCDNNTGILSWNKCNNSDGVNRTCIDGQCIVTETMNDDNEVWTIEIGIGDVNINSTLINATEILEAISATCGVDAEQLKIGTEVDEGGNLLRIFVFVGDKESANKLLKSMDGCTTSESNYSTSSSAEGCEGILRYVTSTRIISTGLELSVSGAHHIDALKMMLTTVIITIFSLLK